MGITEITHQHFHKQLRQAVEDQIKVEPQELAVVVAAEHTTPMGRVEPPDKEMLAETEQERLHTREEGEEVQVV